MNFSSETASSSRLNFLKISLQNLYQQSIKFSSFLDSKQFKKNSELSERISCFRGDILAALESLPEALNNNNNQEAESKEDKIRELQNELRALKLKMAEREIEENELEDSLKKQLAIAKYKTSRAIEDMALLRFCIENELKLETVEEEIGSLDNQAKHKMSPEDAKELGSLVTLLWGSGDVSFSAVFARWGQGFIFSTEERSALVQNAGGPCSVIAAVQAYILKHLIMELPASHQFKDLTEEKCKKILVKAVCNILLNCKERPTHRIVILDKLNDVEKALEATEGETSENDEAVHMEMSMDALRSDTNEMTGVSETHTIDGEDLTPDKFHERLVIQDFETIEEVEKFYSENFGILENRYGILLHLYSVLFTKGIENLLNEVSDTSEPLITPTFGYGSQSLINLMLTGRAVQHVFDNEQDIGGMKLKGIEQQSEIGFITLMEQLRYCTVGSFFKNPKHPIWVMGSETHLTVLFSNEKSLVSPETPAEHARRVFSQYDTESSSFISSAVLQDVLAALGLESDAGYVEIMRKKLDPDATSIVLLSDFMYEFFPDDKKSTPDTFDLFHYNGIPNSNEDHKVRYSSGKAILLESHIADMCSQSNAMLTCLQTKWPNIEINWSQRVPSLN